MARTPKELLAELQTHERATADRIEREIDATLDAKYQGGSAHIVFYERLSPRVQQELAVRFSAWDVTFLDKPGFDPKEPDSYVTTVSMSPSPPVPF
jgi:6-phosphogluconolactonase/glucosamine-6-phosphate isomerase/deaminase